MIVELQKALVESGKEKLMVENLRIMVKKKKASFVMSFLPARGGQRFLVEQGVYFCTANLVLEVNL